MEKTRFDDYILKKSEEITGVNKEDYDKKVVRQIAIAGNIRANVLNSKKYDSWDYVPFYETPFGRDPLRNKLSELLSALFTLEEVSSGQNKTANYIGSLMDDIKERNMKNDVYDYFYRMSLESLKWRFSVNPNFKYRPKK